MYIEVIILLNSFLVLLIIVTATRLLMLRISRLKLFVLFLSSLPLIWYPLLSLLLLTVLIVLFFASDRRSLLKLMLISCMFLFTIGGVIQLVAIRPLLLFITLLIALLTVRVGKSLFIQHHAKSFVKEVTCGPLTIKGYWDTGNQCTDPLSSEPVHFIRQDVIEQYPELFAKTKRLLSLSTVTTSDLYPLYEIVEPLSSEGSILAGRYVAPVKTNFPFESQVLLHHYAFQ
ncbi:sigma-E processing peptidase SpoIIGA [Chryseomicrobium palamuruense]|uniref:Sigma-E processing peptidase SpoIIGA n=1 Tax=Chryseomicrobium palamuruense TaxID=682973 RepID=A0ABV8UUZ7_9BACL